MNFPSAVSKAFGEEITTASFDCWYRKLFVAAAVQMLRSWFHCLSDAVIRLRVVVPFGVVHHSICNRVSTNNNSSVLCNQFESIFSVLMSIGWLHPLRLTIQFTPVRFNDVIESEHVHYFSIILLHWLLVCLIQWWLSLSRNHKTGQERLNLIDWLAKRVGLSNNFRTSRGEWSTHIRYRKWIMKVALRAAKRSSS